MKPFITLVATILVFTGFALNTQAEAHPRWMSAIEEKQKTQRSASQAARPARRAQNQSARRGRAQPTRSSSRRTTRTRTSRRSTNRSTQRSSSRSSGGRFIRSTQRVSVAAYRGRVRRQPPGTVLEGMASYYWQPQPVASGGRFNPDALTAAHKTLPFWTRVRVTNLNNGRSVVVTINDRGPYIRGRIIDLSRRAATVVGMRSSGIAPVRVVVLGGRGSR